MTAPARAAGRHRRPTSSLVDRRRLAGLAGCPSWILRGGRANGTASLWLFTGDLDSDRTAAWPCRTPGCPTATRRHYGRCDVAGGPARRPVSAGRSSTPRRRGAPPARCADGAAWCPAAGASCTCRACVSGMSGPGVRHGRPSRWRSSPPGPDRCRVPSRLPGRRLRPRATSPGAGCAGSTTIGCTAQRNPASMRTRSWPRGSPTRSPGLGVHQFSLAGLPELLRIEVLYALQQRDAVPPPLDPTAGPDPAGPPGRGRIAPRRRPASGVRVRRHASTTRPPGACSATCAVIWTGPGPTTPAPTPIAGDVWQVALLDLQPNASRPWPATQGRGRLRRDRASPGCGRSSRTGPATPGPTCSGCGRRCAPARPPRRR